MKKILSTLLVVMTSLAAFAQGRITFANDSLHLLYFSNFPKFGDEASAGQLVGNTGGGANLIIDLYGGTSAGTMTLQTSTVMSPTPGRFATSVFISPNLPGGVTAFMQVQIREIGFANASLSELGGGYWGFSDIFTFTPSSTIGPNSIVNPGGTALSTFAAEPQTDLGDINRIVILPIPEPSFLTLTGSGIAALLFRKKKL